MKKNLLMIAAMAILSTAAAMAQPRAVGARFGYGAEFSYEHSLGQNMLSVDAGLLGFGVNHLFGVEGVVTYDWLNPGGHDFPAISKGDWNWYAGVGGGVGSYFNHQANGSAAGYTGDVWTDKVFVGVAGRIGVEYNFWFPLQLSVDWRPVIGPSLTHDRYVVNGSTQSSDWTTAFNTGGLYYGGLSLAVRYKF